MKERHVIKASNLPARLPVQLGIILWLLLDRTHAPEWVWAVFGTLYAILFATVIWMVCTQKAHDVPGFGDR